MFETIEEIYHKFNYNLKNKEKYDYLEDYILNLFNNGVIENDTGDKICWNAKYYKDVKNNFEEMKKQLGDILSISLPILPKKMQLNLPNMDKIKMPKKKKTVLKKV